MRKLLLCGSILVVIGVIVAGSARAGEQWPGVDEAVVKKFAEEAGRPAREPYINTGEGDLQLFCFLVAGIIGGFIVGYQYRALFPPKPKPVTRTSHV
jgi:cobalt/nickel transport system permease protein/cobalt/nickel transport protein